MIVLGCDFTSAPSPTKPITVARCRLDGAVLTLERVERCVDFTGFEALLDAPGPWVAGFDFPFGQARRFLEQAGWPLIWAEYVRRAEALGARGFAAALEAYKADRPAGDKQHRRLCDTRTGAQSPQTLYGTPVAKMWFQGAVRLLRAGVHLPLLRETGDDRVALEVYPGVAARALAGSASYKAESGVEEGRRRQRAAIVAALGDKALRQRYGVTLALTDAQGEALVDEPKGDALDAVLAAVQAAWASRRPDWGIPAEADAAEGWICDPAALGEAAEPTKPRVEPGYNFAYLDEQTKRMIRRAILKAVAIPGYQVPFASRDMPLPYGWGTGGIQVTAACIGPDDILKVIDQGADDTTNAVSIRRFFQRMTGVATTEATTEATLIQTRHRIPEEPLKADQILVYQVPIPEPLRFLEPRETETRQMHALQEYGVMHVKLYEDIARMGRITTSYNYPVRVHGRYLMSPSPTPKFDNPKMSMNPALQLFGAGREKRIYAVPPFTEVTSLDFEDHPFEVQRWDRPCGLCGARDSYLDEVVVDDAGTRLFCCSDTDYCARRRAEGHRGEAADSAFAGATS